MTLNSMTGFARTEGDSDACTWVWEAKSVNAKGLDVRVRLPHGFDRLEQTVRERGKKQFQRGNISVNLNIRWERPQASYRVDVDTLDRLLSVVPELRDRVPDIAAPSVDGLLGLKGVIEAVEDTLDEASQEALEAILLDGLDRTLAALKDARGEEGARLSEVVTAQLTAIAGQCSAAGDLAALRPDAIRARLLEQVRELADAVPPLSEERLAQEAAVLMLKADIREELDRLQAHLEAADELVAGEGAVGRRFDFLCQEFNREANTLCSKSSDVALTRVGLELKTTIDQLREQVQNIE